MMKNKRLFVLFTLILLALMLTAFGTPNPLTNVPLEETGKVYGFWNGLWDGITAILAFVGNLFGGNYNIYQVHNNGGWYNFGYLFGIGAFAKGATSTTSRRRK